ncbi:c-type cytochrome [Azospirillum sp. TSO35-2]|uniref:c-type cytochrome n=1 Tax=Azospirillum sp. TSO35-2 TaxID=716796 RepID=UPI000D652C4C|nr:c-type cytochrome [Azospirillum sp. TSO35-2]
MPKHLIGLCTALAFTGTLALGTAFGQQDATKTPSAQNTQPQSTQEAKIPDAKDKVDDQGVPLYTVKDGKVDQGTYNGYRRYASSCHVCHGPDGLGSSFAPALVDSLKRMDYWQFTDVVTNGRTNMGATGDKVMPTFGSDPNVMLNLADIYRYLKARSDDQVGRGRPERFPAS